MSTNTKGNEKNNSNRGILLGCLFFVLNIIALILIFLKIIGIISWSWILVLLPIIPQGCIVIFIIVVFLLSALLKPYADSETAKDV